MEGILIVVVVILIVALAVLSLSKFQRDTPKDDVPYLYKTINSLNYEVSNKKSENSYLVKRLSSLEAEIDGLEKEKQTYQDKILLLDEKLREKTRELIKANVVISNKKDVIQGLNMQCNELKDSLKNAQEDSEKAEWAYSELYDKWQASDEEIARLNGEIESFDEILQSKNPFDYVAHLRAHALQHQINKNEDDLASLYKYQYKFEYLLSIYPELRKFKDDDAYINYMHEEEKKCNIRNWLSDDEYSKLSEEGREQHAVNNYIMQSNKWSDWEKGRNYEIYCAYKLYNEGYDIVQEGLNKKLEDGGRDIIATHRETGKILIVQCKNWSTHSQIRENVVFQLYGSYVQWKIDNENAIRQTEIEPWLYVTCNLSAEAIKCANLLGVMVRHLPMDQFPAIKCNVNHNTGQKIYHLPFDRHYDLVKINAKGKGYKFDIAEAIGEGFRRAYNH